MHVLAFDVIEASEVLLSHGPAVDVISAAAAIPGVFPPVSIGDRRLTDAGHHGISAFVAPRDAGVVVDKHEDKMGQRASNTAAITFNIDSKKREIQTGDVQAVAI